MTSNSPNSPHNSTLTISPLVPTRRRDLFHTTTPNEGNRSRIFGSSTPASSLNKVVQQQDIVDTEDVTQADRLRLWRHDSLMQHHYKTAEYIGDKVLALTQDPNDAFWLLQVHYSTGNYQRLRDLLQGKRFDESVSCRYLACLCLIKLEKWDEALDIIGEENPFKDDNNIKNQDGGIKLEASMCYLRGVIYSNFNNFAKLKECFKEAVKIDVKCLELFQELVNKNLMTPREEWEFLSSLNFSDADNNDELVRLLYITKLNKYSNIEIFEESESRLKEEYNLIQNNDLLLARADLFFIQCRFQQCLDVCEVVLQNDQFNFNILPNYLSCLYELNGKNKLFLISHKLAEFHPNNHITWLAIAIYYLSINKIIELRKFFSKLSLLNPNFGQAWIGFAHTFALEGEHEQAISAYATLSRLFPGSHLPNLFLGMQYLQMNNLSLASEYLNYSYSICPSDPLLLNEIGVINYHKSDLLKLEFYFDKLLTNASNLQSDSKSWLPININLGHVYRRLKKYDKLLYYFNNVLKISSKDSNIYCSIGLIYLKQKKVSKLIDFLHKLLSISPNDPVLIDLLKKLLDENLSLKFVTKSTLGKLEIPSFKQKDVLPNIMKMVDEMVEDVLLGSESDDMEVSD